MKYSDEQRLKKIYDNAEKLNQYRIDTNLTKEALMSEFTLQWLVTTPLYNIGEQAYSISDEFKQAHPEIEWNLMSGLRHRLVHDYEGTNWTIIAEVVFNDIPELLEQIKRIREDEA